MSAGRVSLDSKYAYSGVTKGDFSSGGDGDSKKGELASRAKRMGLFVYISRIIHLLSSFLLGFSYVLKYKFLKILTCISKALIIKTSRPKLKP